MKAKRLVCCFVTLVVDLSLGTCVLNVKNADILQPKYTETTNSLPTSRLPSCVGTLNSARRRVDVFPNCSIQNYVSHSPLRRSDRKQKKAETKELFIKTQTHPRLSEYSGNKLQPLSSPAIIL